MALDLMMLKWCMPGTKNLKRNWQRISSKIVYKNPWIKVSEDSVITPGGKPGIYGYLEKAEAVFVIAVDNSDSIYMIEEYRYPINKVVLQLPAGMIEGKNLLANAKRELMEETGIKAKKWKNLGGFFVAPGHETTHASVFLATDLIILKKDIANQEADESILKLKKIKIDKLKKMIKDNKIECGPTIAALTLFFVTVGK